MLTPHSCRHTYVSQLQALGVDLSTIQSLVGHVDTDMTQQYQRLHRRNHTPLPWERFRWGGQTGQQEFLSRCQDQSGKWGFHRDRYEEWGLHRGLSAPRERGASRDFGAVIMARLRYIGLSAAGLSHIDAGG